MAVLKKDGSYYIKGKIKKDDGSYYNYKRKVRGATSIRDARNYETDFLRQYQDVQISKTQITFKALCDDFLDSNVDVKQVTLRTKRDVLNKSCDVFGNKKINLITKDYLQKYIRELEKQYSEEYVSKIYYAIGSAFNYAVQQDYLQINPMTKVRKRVNKDKVKKEMQFWEPDQFNTFINYVDDSTYKTLFIFLYHMGTRKGEALALQWKDINFDSNTVNIYKSITNKISGKAWEITSPKTQNSIRNISMPNIVKTALMDWKDEQKKIYGFNEDCFVFGFYRPLSSTTIARRLKDAVDKANVDGHNIPLIRIHDFRHSHASYLINNKSDKFTDFDIANRLGDTVNTLHDTYAHWFSTADASIIEVMNDNAPATKKPLKSFKTNDYDDLIKLKELLDMNVITQEDFNIKKKEILGI